MRKIPIVPLLNQLPVPTQFCNKIINASLRIWTVDAFFGDLYSAK